MLWGGITLKGRTTLAWMKGRQNTKKYLQVLRDFLLPFADENMPVSWMFQQDNASIHTSEEAKSWFEENGVRVMDWPARSPDLNPIENVWGWLARKVYAENRQYKSISELYTAVMAQWENMPSDIVEKLFLSMHERAIKVLVRQGLHTHY